MTDPLVPSLAPLRILEWGRGIAAGHAARLLADLGADVVRVRASADRDPHRDGDAACAALLDAGKQVVTLDLERETDAARLLALAGGVDMVIEDQDAADKVRWGLAPAQLRAGRPGLVVVSLSPFGRTGPYAGFRGGDLEVAFLSGLAHLTPRDIPRPADGPLPPPLKAPASLVSFYAGASAAAAALVALYARDRDHAGAEVDVSMLESLIPVLRREVALAHFGGPVASRFMRVWRLAPYGVKPCRDGYVFLQVVERYHWEGLVDMMGAPAWATDPRYLDAEYRFAQRVDIEARIAPWLLEQDRDAFGWEAQRRSLPFAPINGPEDVARIPQLHHRGFLRALGGGELRPQLVPGMPYRFGVPTAAGHGTPAAAASAAPTASVTPGVPAGAPASAAPVASSAPAQGASARTLPLAGMRVVDFGHVWAGPYCAALLADMGAEVIKVESLQRVDIHRRQGPYAAGTPGVNRSGVWNTQNRGKRSVALNLATDRGRDLARRLAASADVVIENFAPGVMHRLGLDYGTLAALNAALVMVSLSAFGQSGPQKDYVGYGPSLDAWAGLDWLTAYPDGPPNALGGVFPDTGSAIHAAVALLAALRERDRTGRGRYVDVSELEVSIGLIADVVTRSLAGQAAPRPGNGDAHYHPHGCHACAGDDQWIALSVTDLRAWEGLCAVLGRDDWRQDAALRTAEGRREQRADIDAAIAAWARPRDAGDAMQVLQAAGVAAGRSHTPHSLLDDPHLKARRFFESVEHPECGPQPMYGPIWRFGAEATRVGGPAPLLGADSEHVLCRMLDVTTEEYTQLVADRVVY